MNRIHKLAIPVLLLMMCAALSCASAQPAIKAEDGGSLPGSIDIGETFTVLVTENGSPVGAGTSVTLRLPYDTGDPVLRSTDDDGKVRYKPLVTGTLGIRVLDGTVTVAEATVAVTDITSKTTQPSGSPSGSGSGGDYLPPATPTVTATAAPTAPPGATPKVTPVATPVEMVETPPAEVEVETPAPTPKTGVPGFTSVFAIAGLLAALYLVLQRRE
jgi:PGF-CTERM protein